MPRLAGPIDPATRGPAKGRSRAISRSRATSPCATVCRAIYRDGRSAFAPSSPARRPEPAEDDPALSQVGRALVERDIDSIAAGSPQAKGRIERLWGTFQDRLVVELRLAGVVDRDGADAYLPGYLARHNARFVVSALEPVAAWRALPPDVRLGCRPTSASTASSSSSTAARSPEPESVSGCIGLMSPVAASSARSRAIGVIVLAGLLAGCARPAPTGSRPTGSAAATVGPVSTASTIAARATPQPSTRPSVPGSIPSGDPISRGDLEGRIAFAYDDGVWVGDASGGHRRRLTHDGGFDPTFSPDGSRIAYRLLLAADDGEIWVMDAAGGHRHDLVNDPDFSDWGPAWSPDGREIAYDSNRRVGLAIWLMQVDGSNQHVISQGHGEYPSWSPDGKRIAYSGGGYYDIHVVDADGSNDIAVTNSPAYDMGPAWSPDGQWIAYHTQADYYPNLGEAGMGPEMEIHLVHPDGSADHRITVDQVEDSFPAWSPDGRYLMWSRHGELVVTRADGSGMVDIGPGNFPSWIR